MVRISGTIFELQVRISGIHTAESVADLLAMPKSAEVDFNPVRSKGVALREVDLS